MKNFIQQYKVHVIIWAIGLLIFGYYIYKDITAPSYLLRGFMLNANTAKEQTYTEDLTKDFVEKYNIDLNRGDVLLDDSRVCVPNSAEHSVETGDTANEIFLGKANQSLDFILGSTDLLKQLIYESSAGGTNIVSDLSSTLSSTHVELYESRFLYVDQDVIDKLAEAYKKDKDTSHIELPDMTKPEDMKNPIPVLVDISNSPKLSNIYGKDAENLAFAIIEGTPGQNIALNFLEYITLEEKQ